MKGYDGGPIIRGGKNAVPTDTEQYNGETEIEVFFLSLIPEREVATLWEGLLSWRVLERYQEQIREK